MTSYVCDDQGKVVAVPDPWPTVGEAELIIMGGVICDDEAIAEARRVLYANRR